MPDGIGSLVQRRPPRQLQHLIRSPRLWPVVLAVVLVAAGAGLVASHFRHATYSASATLRLATVSASNGGGLSPDLEYTDRLANTYRSVVASAPLRNAVQTRLNLSARPAVTASLPANTELIRIGATARSAGLAAEVANAAAAELIKRSEAFAQQDTDAVTADLRARLKTAADSLNAARRIAATRTASGARLVATSVVALREEAYLDLRRQYDAALSPWRRPSLAMVEPARAPSSPDFPSPDTLPLIAIAFGLVAGTALAVWLSRRDTRLPWSSTVLRVGRTLVIGEIPRSRRRPNVFGAPDRPVDEAFRRLRANVMALTRQAEGRRPDHAVLLITSAGRGEGKTTVATHLAASLAQGGNSVLLIDADAEAPRIHGLLSIPSTPGLRTLLQDESTLDAAITRTTIDCLSVIPSGTSTVHRVDAGLSDSLLEELVPRLRERFEYVVIDASSLLRSSAAATLAACADGVLVVIRDGRTRQESLQEAREALALVNAQVLGVVVNRATSDHSAPVPARV